MMYLHPHFINRMMIAALSSKLLKTATEDFYLKKLASQNAVPDEGCKLIGKIYGFDGKTTSINGHPLISLHTLHQPTDEADGGEG